MTITCPVCDNRVFASKDALLQHIKSSSAWHPSCDACDRRFTSQTALDAHTEAKHPPTYDCDICERQYHASFALEDHYRGSAAHPNCIRCGRGFKDQQACDLHFQSSHRKIPCIQCANQLVYEDELEYHFRGSINHPTCMDCHIGLRDEEALIKHREIMHLPMQSPSPVVSAKIEETEEPEAAIVHSSESELGNVNKTESSPPPSMALVTIPSIGNKLVGAGLDVSRVLTPELRIQEGFFSPLTEVRPPFSPLGLPNPGDHMEAIWTRKANIEAGNLIPLHRSIEAPPAPSPKPSTSPTLQPPIFRGAPGPKLIEFNTRLYQGSARQAFRYSGPAPASGSRPSVASSSQSSSSYPHSGIKNHSDQEKTFASSVSSNRSAWRYSNSNAGSNHHPSHNNNSSQVGLGRLRGYSAPQAHDQAQSPSFSFSSPFQRQQQHVHQQPMRWRSTGQSTTTSTTSPTTTRPMAAELRTTNNYVYSTPASSANSTSTFYPLSPGARAVPVLSPLSSTSIWAHSPASAQHSELTESTSPTSAWSTPSIKTLTYSAPDDSKSSGPHSPQVTSPVGLAMLPTISPLVTTPIDITAFDYDKAAGEKEDTTLSYSPIETSLSPVPTIVQDLEAHEQTPASSICSSLPEMEVNTTPSTAPVPKTAISPVCMTRTTSTASARWHENPLHCRECSRESCDDITATMCGHLFCNRCITAAVIKNNRCPVCQTPTLLYCLFRLDLAA